MKRLRVGVVGVGHLGQHHARILASLPDVDLVDEVATCATGSCPHWQFLGVDVAIGLIVAPVRN